MNTGANERKRKLWDAVDFSKPSGLIAYEMGVHETTVSRQRRMRGINIRVERWRGVDWNRTNQDISGELGITVEAVKYQRVKAGLLPQRKKRVFGPEKYAKVDWRKTTKTIAREMNVSDRSVRRQRNNLCKK